MTELRSRPAVWPAFVTFIAAVAATLLASGAALVACILLLAVRSGASLSDPFKLVDAVMADPWMFTVMLATTPVALAGVALLAAFIETRGVRERLRLRPAQNAPAIVLLGALGLMSAGQVAESLVAIAGWGGNSILAEFSRRALTSPLPAFIMLLLVGGVGAGIGEELLFRGYIQKRLVDRWGRWTGIAVASALFGLMHMDPVQSPLTFGIGLGLGYLVERFGSLRPAIWVHILNNVGAFTFARLGWLSPETPTGALALAAASLVVSVVAWALLVRIRPPAVAAAEPAAEPSAPLGA